MANVIKHKRGSGSDPVASDLVVGEVAIRTDVGKLFTKMDNGSVAEIAGGGSDIAINTLSSSSATGGGSATFNGSAYRFTLSAPPSVSAQQLLVSINGVIQKPVAGTGQPSEGFSVDGTDIILGDAPATGSDFFILTFKSLGVSEPADNSVTSAKIVDGAIVNADINASAAIAGSKISPTFTSSVTISNTNPKLFFTDTNNDSDYAIVNNGGVFRINDETNSINRFSIASDGTTTILQNLDVGAGIDVTGAITGTGDMTIDTNTLHVDSSNNRVGIGTTSPTHMLDISGSNPILALNDTDTTNDRFRLIYNGGSTQLQVDPNNVRSGSHLLVAVDGTERMRIDSSGRVGIGNTNAQQLLHVWPDTANTSSAYVRVTSGDRGSGTGIDLGSDSDGDGRLNVVSNANLKLYTNNTERMRIDTSGNVGINQTNPSRARLHVVGDDTDGDIVAKFKSGGGGADSTSFIALVTGYPDDANDYEGHAHIGVQRNGATNGTHILFKPHSGSGTSTTERMRIESSGRVLIDTTSHFGTALAKLQVNGNGIAAAVFNRTNNGVVVGFQRSGGTDVGTISVTASSTAYNTSSDYRLKENQVAISDGITRIKTLKPYRFNFKADASTTLDGFFAHEVSSIVPEAITGTKDEVDENNEPVYQGIDQSKLVPLLVAAVQELTAKVEALEAK